MIGPAALDGVLEMLILGEDHLVRIATPVGVVTRTAELPARHGLHSSSPSSAGSPWSGPQFTVDLIGDAIGQVVLTLLES
jgi:hypothetical protein